MKKSVITLMAAAGLLTFSLAAQQQFPNYNQSATWKNKQVTAGTDGATLDISQPVVLQHSTRIKIDKNATYRFSGEIRKAKGTPSSPYFIYLATYAKNRQPIHPAHMCFYKGTDTVLTADVPRGATVIRVKDGSKWKVGDWNFVAFNTHPSFKDIPNYDMSNNGIKAVKKDGNDWQITLLKPLKRAYKKGINIREHVSGGWHHIAGRSNTTDRWVKFEVTLKGHSIPPKMDPRQFWQGSDTFAPMMFINNNRGSKDKEKFKTQLRNLKVEIIK